jgi:hypothetical protein
MMRAFHWFLIALVVVPVLAVTVAIQLTDPLHCVAAVR